MVRQLLPSLTRLAAIVLLAALTSRAHALEPTKGSRAPDVTLYSVNSNGEQRLYEYLGESVGLIFVWTSGCPSCAPGAAAIGGLLARYAAAGVKGILVTLEGDREISALTLEVLKPAYVIAIDERKEFRQRYAFETFPTVLVVDADKTIRYVGQQVELYTEPKVAVRQIEQALRAVLEAPR